MSFKEDCFFSTSSLQTASSCQIELRIRQLHRGQKATSQRAEGFWAKLLSLQDSENVAKNFVLWKPSKGDGSPIFMRWTQRTCQQYRILETIERRRFTNFYEIKSENVAISFCFGNHRKATVQQFLRDELRERGNNFVFWKPSKGDGSPVFTRSGFGKKGEGKRTCICHTDISVNHLILLTDK